MDFRADDGCGLLAPVAAFFTGGWSVVRRIRNNRTHELGRLHGRAHFVQDAAGLQFIEQGVLALPQARAEARQSYRFVFENDHAFSVFFADGGFFHQAKIVAGIAAVAHDCAPDIYRGRYRFLSPDRWSLSWRITGPRKDLVISTVFSRGCRS